MFKFKIVTLLMFLMQSVSPAKAAALLPKRAPRLTKREAIELQKNQKLESAMFILQQKAGHIKRKKLSRSPIDKIYDHVSYDLLITCGVFPAIKTSNKKIRKNIRRIQALEAELELQNNLNMIVINLVTDNFTVIDVSSVSSGD